MLSLFKFFFLMYRDSVTLFVSFFWGTKRYFRNYYGRKIKSIIPIKKFRRSNIWYQKLYQYQCHWIFIKFISKTILNYGNYIIYFQDIINWLKCINFCVSPEKHMYINFILLDWIEIGCYKYVFLFNLK